MCNLPEAFLVLYSMNVTDQSPLERNLVNRRKLTPSDSLPIPPSLILSLTSDMSALGIQNLPIGRNRLYPTPGLEDLNRD